jgi:hypothetical protein
METMFTIEYHQQKISVEEKNMGGRMLYLVHFTGRPALFITKASDMDGSLFWTSVPEGRQQVALEIGALIDQHLKTVF